MLERCLQLVDPLCQPLEPAQLEADQLDAARELMERLARVYPNGWGWDYQRLGDVCRRLGRWERAVYYYRKACRYAPRSSRPAECLAQVWLALGDSLRAERAFRQALRRDPGRIALRDEVRRCQGLCSPLDDLAPPRALPPPWQTSPVRPVFTSQIGFHDVCDASKEHDVVLREFRQVLYQDGAWHGRYRLVARVKYPGVFALTYPGVHQAKLLKSLLYRSHGAVEDTCDLRQGGWAVYPDCIPGDLAEAEWLFEGSDDFEWEVQSQADSYTLCFPIELEPNWSREPEQIEVAKGWRVVVWIRAGTVRVGR
ncbi:MAG: tetratricopeptide repeat protein [Vulcanimicrobiota bacterium]